MFSIKHVGRGKFSAFDEDDNRVGPIGSREEVEAWVSSSAPSASADEGAAAPAKPIDPREYERRLDAAFIEARTAVSDDVSAALLNHYGADQVEAMMRELVPIITDPNGDRRRRRRLNRGM